MPQDIGVAAGEEVSRIWGEYGVDVQTSARAQTIRDGAVRIAVVFVEHHDRGVAPQALGSIAFSDDVPQPVIFIYPTAIATLVSGTEVLGKGARDWSPVLRDRVLGRVAGRALAHELGHFLLRSRQHSADGLMRAQLRAADLVRPDARLFVLSGDEVARLQSVTSTSIRAAQ